MLVSELVVDTDSMVLTANSVLLRLLLVVVQAELRVTKQQQVKMVKMVVQVAVVDQELLSILLALAHLNKDLLVVMDIIVVLLLLGLVVEVEVLVLLEPQQEIRLAVRVVTV